MEWKFFRYPPQAAANYILSPQGCVKIKYHTVAYKFANRAS